MFFFRCVMPIFLCVFFCCRCGMPMCGKECETKGYHPLECGAFVKAKFRVDLKDFVEINPLYESILPLRCFLLKDNYQKKWETLQAMESHDELRRGSELWEIEQVKIFVYSELYIFLCTILDSIL